MTDQAAIRTLKEKINELAHSISDEADLRGNDESHPGFTIVWKDSDSNPLDRSDENIDELESIILQKGDESTPETFSILFKDNKIVGIISMPTDPVIKNFIEDINEVCRAANYHKFRVYNSTPLPSTEVTESAFYGKDKTSYQDLDENLRLVIKHGNAVNPEVKGSRARNIKKIYVECDGERSVLPTTSTRLARGLARHWQTARSWDDEFGQHILEQLDLYRKLNKTLKYINKNKINNEEADGLRKHAALYRRNLSSWFDQLQTNDGYSQCSCNYAPVETADDIDAVKDALTVKLLDPDVEEILPILSAITKSGCDRERNMMESLTQIISQPFRASVSDTDPREIFSGLTEMSDDEIITSIINRMATESTDQDSKDTFTWCLENMDSLTPETRKNIFRSYTQGVLSTLVNESSKESNTFESWIQSKINPDYLK